MALIIVHANSRQDDTTVGYWSVLFLMRMHETIVYALGGLQIPVIQTLKKSKPDGTLLKIRWSYRLSNWVVCSQVHLFTCHHSNIPYIMIIGQCVTKYILMLWVENSWRRRTTTYYIQSLPQHDYMDQHMCIIWIIWFVSYQFKKCMKCEFYKVNCFIWSTNEFLWGFFYMICPHMKHKTYL